MNEMICLTSGIKKKELSLEGSLLLPLAVGKSAVIRAGSHVYHTARVVAIYGQSENSIDFETRNIRYHLSMRPLPLAAIRPLHKHQRLAACA